MYIYDTIQNFDSAYSFDVTLDDLDEDKIRRFIRIARENRAFPLPLDVATIELLTYLDLMSKDGRITNAAILLFGKKPQRFLTSSAVKCVQFYGNVVEEPIPSYQIYRGDVFEMTDKATAFVMSSVDNWVGTREGPTASIPTRPELPPSAVQEAIVNAICHRDYASNASVQVMIFRNRVEILNPGMLPYGLTIKHLYDIHMSYPANPLLANAMYLNGYIEKVGTGTEDIIKKCSDYGLRTPEFQQDNGFKVIIWRNDTIDSSFVSNDTKADTKADT